MNEIYSLFLAILFTDPQNSRSVTPDILLSLRAKSRETCKTWFSIEWCSQTIYVGHAARSSRSEEYEFDSFIRMIGCVQRFHLARGGEYVRNEGVAVSQSFFGRQC